jgi:hypothetical protein
MRASLKPFVWKNAASNAFQVWGDTTEDSGRKIDAFVQSQYFKDPPIVPGAREVLEALKVCEANVDVSLRRSP